MKLMTLVLLAALTQTGSDPEKLILAMEEKITNATSVQIAFDGKLESKMGNGSANGTLTFAPKGKARADMALDLLGKKMKMQMVSDGTNMDAREDEKGAKVERTPEFLTKSMVVMVAKIGIMPGLLFSVRSAGSDGKEKDPFAGWKVTDFKLGKVEQIGGKDAQIVEYRLSIPSSQDKLDVTVWIDVKTTLPIKRQLVANMGGDRVTIIENYSEFRLNAKLDAKVFDLPK